MNGAQDPRKQHVVSRVLLKQFVGSDGKLTSVNLRFGRAGRRDPSQVGWVRDFVGRQSRELERLWGVTESSAQAAIDSATAGTVFDSPDAVLTLKSLIALHFMRNTRVRELWRITYASSIERIQAPPHFPGNKAVFESVVGHRLIQDAERGFAEQQRDAFQRARSRVEAAGLEIIRTDSPVLIGDRAVVSATLGPDGVRFEFAPFADASTHVLPIGPRHLVALGGDNKYLEVDDGWLDVLNRQQIYEAHSHVFLSPNDPGLLDWVMQIRDEANAKLPSGQAEDAG